MSPRSSRARRAATMHCPTPRTRSPPPIPRTWAPSLGCSASRPRRWRRRACSNWAAAAAATSSRSRPAIRAPHSWASMCPPRRLRPLARASRISSFPTSRSAARASPTSSPASLASTTSSATASTAGFRRRCARRSCASAAKACRRMASRSSATMCCRAGACCRRCAIASCCTDRWTPIRANASRRRGRCWNCCRKLARRRGPTGIFSSPRRTACSNPQTTTSRTSSSRRSTSRAASASSSLRHASTVSPSWPSPSCRR